MSHTITAEILCHFQPVSLTEMESGLMKVEIEYTATRQGVRHTPRGEYAPIDPPEPDEILFIAATLIDASDLGFDPEQEWIDDKAQGWLYDEGYCVSCRHAARDD